MDLGLAILLVAHAVTHPAAGRATGPIPPAPARFDTVRFAGRVRRAETYRHALGPSLEFRLTPIRGVSDGAWSIGIWPPDSVPADYSAVATPPYRGISHLDVEGWHFRNAANTGPNRGDVNAPQKEREFFFVESRADFDSAYQAVERVLWPYGLSDEAVDHAARLLDSLATGAGTLRITSLALTAPKAGTQAEIDSMRFEVTLIRTRKAAPR